MRRTPRDQKTVTLTPEAGCPRLSGAMTKEAIKVGAWLGSHDKQELDVSEGQPTEDGGYSFIYRRGKQRFEMTIQPMSE